MAGNALQLVFEQREKQVNEALQAYQQAQQTLFEQRSQLQNLHQYRQQYSTQLSQKGREGLSIADLNKYQQFIVQIDLGVSKHQEGLVQFEYDVQAHKKMWLERQVKCKAIGMLIEKKAIQKQQVEDKKEQQQLDEFSLFQFLKNKARH